LSKSTGSVLIVGADTLAMLAADRLLLRGGESSRTMIAGCGFLDCRSVGVSTGSSLMVVGDGSMALLCFREVGGVVSLFSFLSSGGTSPFSQNVRRSCFC
jgi:hypothetical protein